MIEDDPVVHPKFSPVSEVDLIDFTAAVTRAATAVDDVDAEKVPPEVRVYVVTQVRLAATALANAAGAVRNRVVAGGQA